MTPIAKLALCAATSKDLGSQRHEFERIGFDFIENGPDRVLVRREWRSFVLRDLLEDFRSVPLHERKVIGHGRRPHFSYHPQGAPGPVFVRSLARGGLFGRLLGTLHWAPYRPVAEVWASMRASLAGVRTPQIIAVHSRKAGVFSWRHRVLTLELKAPENLLCVLPRLGPAESKALLLLAAKEIGRLHEAGIYPKDLTVGNLVLSDGYVHIVDLDLALSLPSRRVEEDARNLARLHRSEVKHLNRLSRAEKLRFLREYLGGSWCLRDMALRAGGTLWLHKFAWAIQRILNGN